MTNADWWGREWCRRAPSGRTCCHSACVDATQGRARGGDRPQGGARRRRGPRMCPATGGERALHGGGRHRRGPGGAGGRFRPGAVARCRYCQDTGTQEHQRSRFGYRRGREHVFEIEVGAWESDRTVQHRVPKLGRHSEECCSDRAASDQRRREDRRVERTGCRIGREDATERERNRLRVKALAGERHRGRDERAAGRREPEIQLGIMHAVESGLPGKSSVGCHSLPRLTVVPSGNGDAMSAVRKFSVPVRSRNPSPIRVIRALWMPTATSTVPPVSVIGSARSGTGSPTRARRKAVTVVSCVFRGMVWAGTGVPVSCAYA